MWAHCHASAKLEHRATLLDWQNNLLQNNSTINSLIPLITESGDDGALAYFSRTALALITDALNLANLNMQAPQEINTAPPISHNIKSNIGSLAPFIAWWAAFMLQAAVYAGKKDTGNGACRGLIFWSKGDWKGTTPRRCSGSNDLLGLHL